VTTKVDDTGSNIKYSAGNVLPFPPALKVTVSPASKFTAVPPLIAIVPVDAPELKIVIDFIATLGFNGVPVLAIKA
tara:strand:+ start:494 stop:721 length:228 start_codon:yes stop_codon:yes gene_type:complete